jgi:hypothetical protein
MNQWQAASESACQAAAGWPPAGSHSLAVTQAGRVRSGQARGPPGWQCHPDCSHSSVTSESGSESMTVASAGSFLVKFGGPVGPGRDSGASESSWRPRPAVPVPRVRVGHTNTQAPACRDSEPESGSPAGRRCGGGGRAVSAGRAGSESESAAQLTCACPSHTHAHKCTYTHTRAGTHTRTRTPPRIPPVSSRHLAVVYE